MHWNQFRGLLLKFWNTNYQYRLDKLRLQTLNNRRSYLKQCTCLWSVHFSELSYQLPFTFLTLTPLALIIIFLYMYPPPTQMLNVTPFFCDAVHTWNSLPYSVTSLPSLDLFKKTVSNCLQLLLCLYCIVFTFGYILKLVLHCCYLCIPCLLA